MTTLRRDQPRTTPIASPSLVDAVHQAIRSRILTGAITPGSTVTELGVATAYGVSPVTAMVAVERLVHDGLLRRTAHRSARVPVASADDVLDAYLARRLLEGSAVQQLAEKGVVPEKARRAFQCFKAGTEDHQWRRAVEAEDTFHRSLVDALGNFEFSRIFGSYMDEAQLYQAQIHHQTWDLLADTSQDYAATITAIEARDPAQAARIIDTHLYRQCTRTIEQLRDITNPTATATIVRPSQWRRKET